MRFLFSSLLLISVIWIYTSSANREGDSLYAFKRAVKDPNGVLQSWNSTLINPCTWFHVTCDNENSVTRVDLGEASLSGPLVPEFGNLKKLQYLNLFSNHLIGFIPQEFGKLKHLIRLDLHKNSLSGQIPSSLGNLTSLKYLDLSYNNLSGPIPEGGALDKFTPTSFKGNPGLCGKQAQRKCS